MSPKICSQISEWRHWDTGLPWPDRDDQPASAVSTILTLNHSNLLAWIYLLTFTCTITPTQVCPLNSTQSFLFNQIHLLISTHLLSPAQFHLLPPTMYPLASAQSNPPPQIYPLASTCSNLPFLIYPLPSICINQPARFSRLSQIHLQATPVKSTYSNIPGWLHYSNPCTQIHPFNSDHSHPVT